MDPFQWIKNDGVVRTFLPMTHFQFIENVYYVPLVISGLAVVAALVPAVRRQARFRALISPIALMVLALGISLFVSYISYRRGYWVLPRQWLASMALCCLSVIWLAKELGEWAKTGGRFLGLPLLSLVAYGLFQTAVPIYRAKQADAAAIVAALTGGGTPKPTVDPTVGTPAKLPANNDEWVALANANIAAGGPVWPIFRRFYARND